MNVNFNSDFTVRIGFKLNTQSVDIPNHDFTLRFRTTGNNTFYDAGRKKGEYFNCYVDETDDTKLLCRLNGHGLAPGDLLCEFYDFVPNSQFADGNQLRVVPCSMGVTLVIGEGDGSVCNATVTVELLSVIGQIVSDIEDLAEETDARFDTDEAEVAAVKTDLYDDELSIVNVKGRVVKGKYVSSPSPRGVFTDSSLDDVVVFDLRNVSEFTLTYDRGGGAGVLDTMSLGAAFYSANPMALDDASEAYLDLYKWIPNHDSFAAGGLAKWFGLDIDGETPLTTKTITAEEIPTGAKWLAVTVPHDGKCSCGVSYTGYAKRYEEIEDFEERTMVMAKTPLDADDLMPGKYIEIGADTPRTYKIKTGSAHDIVVWEVTPGKTYRVVISGQSGGSPGVLAAAYYSAATPADAAFVGSALGLNVSQKYSDGTYDITIPTGVASLAVSRLKSNGRVTVYATQMVDGVPNHDPRIEALEEKTVGSLVLDGPKRERLNILAVGNSFSNDAFMWLPAVLREAAPGMEVNLGILMCGSQSLEGSATKVGFEGDTIYEVDVYYTTSDGNITHAWGVYSSDIEAKTEAEPYTWAEYIALPRVNLADEAGYERFERCVSNSDGISWTVYSLPGTGHHHVTLGEALTDSDYKPEGGWDYIMFQQVSSESCMYDERITDSLAILVDFCVNGCNYGGKFGWVATPAYPEGKKDANTDRLDQVRAALGLPAGYVLTSDEMAGRVLEVGRKVMSTKIAVADAGATGGYSHRYIDVLVPTGAAIQNARKTELWKYGAWSPINGNKTNAAYDGTKNGNLSHDGTHLSNGIANIIEAWTIAYALLGEPLKMADVEGVPVWPIGDRMGTAAAAEASMTAENQAIARMCARAASHAALGCWLQGWVADDGV